MTRCKRSREDLPAVELAGSAGAQEFCPFLRSEGQNGTIRVLAVSDEYSALRVGDFYAVADVSASR